MNIVVDSNIVFSGMLNSDGNLAKVLLLSFNKLTFYSSQSLKEEIYSHAALGMVFRVNPLRLNL